MGLPQARPRRTRPSLMIRGALVLGLLLVAGVGHASAPDRCQADRACQKLSEQATQLAAQRRYEEALTVYQQAYEGVREPLLLINIGRCYYRLGQARKALEFYEEYKKAVPSRDPEVEARLGQWQTEARQAVIADGGSTPGAKVAPPELEPPPAPRSEPAPTPASTGALRRLPRPAWRIGLGSAALGLGGIFIGLGGGALSADGKCATPSTSTPERCAAEVGPDSMRSALLIDGKTPGAALLATGGLLIVGGILLIAPPGRRAN